MRPHYCSDCGSPVVWPDERTGTRSASTVCPECGLEVTLRPGVTVAGILTRDGELGLEVLLVRRRTEVRHGGRRYALPGKLLEWGEDARVAVLRAFWELTGLKVVVTGAHDVHSNFDDPEELTVGTWFRVQEKADGPPQELLAGGDADEVRFFPISRLPELAFATDALALERLAKVERTSGEHHVPDLSAQLHRRKRKYRELLEAYTNELMRTAWINDLHLHLSKEESTADIAGVAVKHLSAWPEVETVYIWYLGPPDQCLTCPWQARCGQRRCLHRIAMVSSRATPGLRQEDERQPNYEGERLPLIAGVPAADVALKAAPCQAELPGAGAQPRRFEGFPLEAAQNGQSPPGVLGLVSRSPLDPNARRLFEVVSHHLGTLVRNARLVDDLRAANRVKLGFISRLSHELKTPLTAILGYSELLREVLMAEGNEMGADGAATIEESGRKLLGIVESILDFAKLQNGTLRIRSQALDLVGLLEERLQSHRQQAKEKGVELSFREQGGEPVGVRGDPERVGRIMDELVNNAVKFTDEGGVIEVSLGRSDGEVVCSIRDSGIGIAADMQTSIFEAFQQVSEKIHLDYGGLGIGLTAAKLLIEAQGGRVWVESQPWRGSVFSFTLPEAMLPD